MILGFATFLMTVHLVEQGGESMRMAQPHTGDATKIGTDREAMADHLSGTVYCDLLHPAIQTLSGQFERDAASAVDLIEKIFLFPRSYFR